MANAIRITITFRKKILPPAHLERHCPLHRLSVSITKKRDVSQSKQSRPKDRFKAVLELHVQQVVSDEFLDARNQVVLPLCTLTKLWIGL